MYANKNGNPHFMFEDNEAQNISLICQRSLTFRW